MLKLARVFQNGAILQREKEIAVWGAAEQNAVVKVTLNNDTVETTANENGEWKAMIPPQNAVWDTKLVVSSGEESVICEDIAIGEVWLAGGQSNMEFYLRFDQEREVAYNTGCNSHLRYYGVPKISYQGQENDENHTFDGQWRKADGEENMRYFSAVGYYFQKYLNEHLNGVPVGIIDATWGGTSASCWMTDDYLTGELEEYIRLRENTKKLDLEMELATFRETTKARSNPKMVEFFEHFMATPIMEKRTMAMNPDDIAKFLRTKYAPFSQFSAAGLYEKMLKTVIPYGISGFIWYQGEEDSNMPHLYHKLFSNMIHCWRDSWGEELPFLFAQLTAFRNPGESNPLDFVPIRRAQTLTARSEKDVHMVCTMDVGLEYDIHPKQKRPVGERLARQALCYAYGQNILCEAPAVEAVKKENEKVTLTFANCGEGFKPCEEVGELKVFINDAEVEFEAKAHGDKLEIRVSGMKSTDICRLEYAEVDYCTMSLYNSVGHPAIPFTVEI